jgi:hypothetical protein
MEGREQKNEQNNEFHHINKVNIKGIIRNITKGVNKSNVPFVNVLIEVKGRKYVDSIPCVAYGVLAESIQSKASVGETVFVYGRLRSRVKEDQFLITFICEQFDVIK